jgi:Spy/CpxP family protein refolding chaperone
MPKSKFSAFISLLLVFLSGSLVGAFAYRLYSVSSVTALKQGPPPRLSPEEFRRRQVEDVRQKVGLDDQQVAEYNKILDNTRQQFDQLHDKMNAEGRAIHDQQVAQVNAILRAEQKPLYDKWRSEREAERKRRQQERDGKKK